MKFTEFNLKQPILDSLEELGFEAPTPIQQQALPVALEGRDMIGQAQTGTGKTAAFGLPILNKLNDSNKSVQALVVAPTRELAIQVQEELFRLGKGQKARVYVVYGGSPIGKQLDRLRTNRPQIVVGTPGRILDLINRKALKLQDLQTLVLDEADEMLNMGFIDDVKSIVEQTPETRQTLLFSATMSPAIKDLSRQFLKEPAHIKIAAKEMTADLIEQHFIKCRDDEKFDILSRLIDVQNPTQSIVFCRTKKRVDEVTRGLGQRGYNAECIHGDIAQQKRTSVINTFRKGNLEILVATDVAARGLDISGVTHVYNYDITQDPESYVHRIGRTGRAGNDGVSITFVTPMEMPYLRTIEHLTRKEMMPMKPPTVQEAQQGQIQQLIDQANDALESGQAALHAKTASLLLQHYPANDIVAALLSQLINNTEEVKVAISPQRPLPNANKKQSSGNRSRGGSRNGGKGYKASKPGDHSKSGRGGKSDRYKSDDRKKSDRKSSDHSKSGAKKEGASKAYKIKKRQG